MKKEIDRVEEPGYCSFAVIRFYGTHFADELAKNTSGYVIRIKQDMDLVTLSDLLRKIFTGKQKFTYGGRTKQLMKIHSIKNYNFDEIVVDELGGKPVHWQEEPFIAVCLETKPMNESVMKTYNIDRESVDLQDATSLKRGNFKF